MLRVKLISVIGTLILVSAAFGQAKKLKLVEEGVVKVGENESYSRAIEIVGDQLWMASSDGVLRSYDLRENVLNFESRTAGLEELRDLYVSDSLVLGMMSGSAGKLLMLENGNEKVLTIQGGDSVFLDVLDINAEGYGAMMGDPRHGFFSLYFTEDFGNSWKAFSHHVPAFTGEAGFAASGSTLKMTSDSSFIFVTGGMKSRMITVELNKSVYTSVNYQSFSLPFKNDEGSGAFSFVIADSIIVVVGGDYLKPDLSEGSCYISKDKGKTWSSPFSSPKGYRSCVIFDIENKILYCSGRNGIDYSLDYGANWKSLSKTGAYCLALHDGKLYGTAKNGEVKIFSIKMK